MSALDGSKMKGSDFKELGKIFHNVIKRMNVAHHKWQKGPETQK